MTNKTIDAIMDDAAKHPGAGTREAHEALRTAITAALARAKAEGLEEAARVADAWPSWKAAAKIRALKGAA